jgi:N-acetyl-anhydromuramyl-L-alanine amidase AmpD
VKFFYAILRLFGFDVPDTPELEDNNDVPTEPSAPTRDEAPDMPDAPDPLPTPPIEDWPLTSFTEGRPHAPWMIVVHYGATFNAEKTWEVLKQRKLSVHFTIERDGRLFRHVSDDDRCWHAGGGSWAGLGSINSHSLGFEIANLGWLDGFYSGGSKFVVFDPAKHGIEEFEPGKNGRVWHRTETYGSSATTVLTRTECKKYPDHRVQWKDKFWSIYPNKQLDSTFWLIWSWMRKYDILPENVVGHEHVDPSRKQDPGPHFPWRKFEAFLEDRLAERPDLFDPDNRRKDRIKAVQSHCARMGLAVGYIDGVWGTKTENAVKAAVEKYGSTYGFSDLSVTPDHVSLIANALRRVPGFDPGRAG